MLTNNPKISDLTKRNVFQLNLSQTEETEGSKCLLADFMGPVNTLTAEGNSETGLFRHLSNHIFQSQ